jgi:N-acyl homoserine lactone hydrolase
VDVVRLHLGWLRGVDERDWPVHGFALKHPTAGVILVDTGIGAPEQVLRDWRVVNRTVADALAEHDLSPADVRIVINTHLHFDHCGQNAVFAHAPIFVQRTELDRARRESAELSEWFDFAGAKFELLNGDTEVAAGIRTVLTPGHTEGHQSVAVEVDGQIELLLGDAAYTSQVFDNPDTGRALEGQAADLDSWLRSLQRLKSFGARRIHYCHDPIITIPARS